jgi:DNA-binding HxlR family transcriptional regulator
MQCDTYGNVTMQTLPTNDNTKCPVEASLNLIQGKVKVMIIFWLMEEPRRINELARLLPDISQRVLTNQLHELEDDGLVHREVFVKPPIKVEYALTKSARCVIPALTSLHDWGKENILP